MHLQVFKDNSLKLNEIIVVSGLIKKGKPPTTVVRLSKDRMISRLNRKRLALPSPACRGREGRPEARSAMLDFLQNSLDKFSFKLDTLKQKRTVLAKMEIIHPLQSKKGL